MCFGISANDDNWLCWGPGFSSTVLCDLMDFRNEKYAPYIQTDEKNEKGEPIWKPDPNFVPQTGGELFARRVVAEIGFALLPVVIVVECVVRMVIGLVASLPCFVVGCILQSDKALAGVALIYVSGMGLLDLPLRCLVALVQNVTEDRLSFNDLVQCEIADCR